MRLNLPSTEKHKARPPYQAKAENAQLPCPLSQIRGTEKQSIGLKVQDQDFAP